MFTSKFSILNEFKFIGEFFLNAIITKLFFIRKNNNKQQKNPVLVIPGFCSGDFATKKLRKYIAKCNFKTYGWNLGINTGYNDLLQEQIYLRLYHIYKANNCNKVNLIGWSLGGIFAREIGFVPEINTR